MDKIILYIFGFIATITGAIFIIKRIGESQIEIETKIFGKMKTTQSGIILFVIGATCIVLGSRIETHPFKEIPAEMLGEWTFTMHSNVANRTYAGSLTLFKDSKNNITGNIQSPDFTEELEGQYDNEHLHLTRKTNYLNTTQHYDLTYLNAHEMTGVFENIGSQNDNGTIKLNR